MTYRPGSVAVLSMLLVYMRKEEIKQQYRANTLCCILSALRGCAEVPMYSDFADKLDGLRREEEKTGKEIINDLIRSIDGW